MVDDRKYVEIFKMELAEIEAQSTMLNYGKIPYLPPTLDFLIPPE